MASQLAVHKENHVTVRQFYCDQCKHTFKRQTQLNRHLKFHSGVRPFPCEQCDKAFVTRGDKAAHMRVHTGERPFACTSCSKAFKHRTDLKKHIWVHTGVKPYQCNTCGRGFLRKAQLTKHSCSFKERYEMVGKNQLKLVRVEQPKEPQVVQIIEPFLEQQQQQHCNVITLPTIPVDMNSSTGMEMVDSNLMPVEVVKAAVAADGSTETHIMGSTIHDPDMQTLIVSQGSMVASDTATIPIETIVSSVESNHTVTVNSTDSINVPSQMVIPLSMVEAGLDGTLVHIINAESGEAVEIVS